MLNGDGTGIDAALLEIAPRQPIEIASIDIHRFVRLCLLRSLLWHRECPNPGYRHFPGDNG